MPAMTTAQAAKRIAVLRAEVETLQQEKIALLEKIAQLEARQRQDCETAYKQGLHDGRCTR